MRKDDIAKLQDLIITKLDRAPTISDLRYYCSLFVFIKNYLYEARILTKNQAQFFSDVIYFHAGEVMKKMTIYQSK